MGGFGAPLSESFHLLYCEQLEQVDGWKHIITGSFNPMILFAPNHYQWVKLPLYYVERYESPSVSVSLFDKLSRTPTRLIYKVVASKCLRPASEKVFHSEMIQRNGRNVYNFPLRESGENWKAQQASVSGYSASQWPSSRWWCVAMV